jgi:hypothetical protein
MLFCDIFFDLYNSYFIWIYIFMFRVRIGNAPPARVTGPEHLSALEKSIRGYAEKPSDIVVKSEIGTGFNSVEEAYDFYNLYSWKVGFGICDGKSRLNIERGKCMQGLFVAARCVHVSQHSHIVFIYPQAVHTVQRHSYELHVESMCAGL